MMNTVDTKTGQPLSEHELVSIAQNLLGSIPNWYKENKAVIRKSREHINQLTSELHDILERNEEMMKAE